MYLLEVLRMLLIADYRLKFTAQEWTESESGDTIKASTLFDALPFSPGVANAESGRQKTLKESRFGWRLVPCKANLKGGL
ncbi:MAG: hypothetical protein ACREDD_01230 [Methylocella sp.]